jgi:hypothetical protein
MENKEHGENKLTVSDSVRNKASVSTTSLKTQVPGRVSHGKCFLVLTVIGLLSYVLSYVTAQILHVLFQIPYVGDVLKVLTWLLFCVFSSGGR